MKIDKNKIKTNLFFLYKSHKLYLVFLAYCFYRMYEKNREFTFYNIVSSLVMSISLYKLHMVSLMCLVTITN